MTLQSRPYLEKLMRLLIRRNVINYTTSIIRKLEKLKYIFFFISFINSRTSRTVVIKKPIVFNIHCNTLIN